jgi:hypothetical protein
VLVGAGRFGPIRYKRQDARLRILRDTIQLHTASKLAVLSTCNVSGDSALFLAQRLHSLPGFDKHNAT